MLSNEEYKKRFDKLYNLFTEISLTYHTWKGLQDKSYNSTFKKNPNFWSGVMFALQNTLLVSLGKIYEESSYSKRDKVISVYALIPHQKDPKRRSRAVQILRKHTRAISAVQRLRDNQFGHNSAKHLLNPTNIQKKFPMTYEEVEELVESSGVLLTHLNPESGHSYYYKIFAEGCRQDSRSVVEKIRYFSKQQEEHTKQFVDGKVSNSQFPPPSSTKNQ